MTARLNPYLSFRDNAREAMTSTRRSSAEPRDQHLRGVRRQGCSRGRSGHARQPDAPDGLTLMGADTPPGMDHARRRHHRQPQRRRRKLRAGSTAATAATSRCRWRSRCGATSSARRPLRHALDGQRRRPDALTGHPGWWRLTCLAQTVAKTALAGTLPGCWPPDVSASAALPGAVVGGAGRARDHLPHGLARRPAGGGDVRRRPARVVRGPALRPRRHRRWA